MSVPNYLTFSRNFFSEHKDEYDFAHADECGRYTEAFVKELRKVDPKVGHLKKSGSATQYNGHAIDAVLYPVGDGVYHSVDIIGNAEQPHPWQSEGGNNADPIANWNEFTGHNYTSADWLAEPGSGGGSQPTMVPWVAYNEQGFERLKKQLEYDYGRRPQSADFDVTVWAARVFHSQYMGPVGVPLGFDAAMQKHRPEWCAALGVPVDNNWF